MLNNQIRRGRWSTAFALIIYRLRNYKFKHFIKRFMFRKYEILQYFCRSIEYFFNNQKFCHKMQLKRKKMILKTQ